MPICAHKTGLLLKLFYYERNIFKQHYPFDQCWDENGNPQQLPSADDKTTRLPYSRMALPEKLIGANYPSPGGWEIIDKFSQMFY